MACRAAVLGLNPAFYDVSVAIDRLKVWQAPIIQQLRPWDVPVFAPHPKQRDAVVDFGALPQSSAGFAAAPCLQAPKEARVVTRRSPELPGDHARAVPDSRLVYPDFPQIRMPTEAIDWLPAYTTKSRTPCVCAFPKGCGWCPERGWQPVLVIVTLQAPTPPARRSTTGSKRACQSISTNWMCAPVQIDCEPWRRWHEWAA